jgi:RHS repeat-associated protein
MVRAQSITATVVYTYTADGLRVGQETEGAEMTFAWDPAAGLAQVLATGDGARDVYGLGRIAEVRGGAWAYPLGDALGSVRQWTDDAGNVTYAAGYAPYGETLWQVGSTQSAWGFTGEWWDANLQVIYLRARWYIPATGRFSQRDPWMGDIYLPPTLIQDYAYVRGNPVRWVDPTGMIEQWWEDMLRDPHWRHVFLDSASRHNLQHVTGLQNDGFAAVLASVVLIEGGNLGGASSGLKGLVGRNIGELPEEQRIPIVACIKNAEIWWNRLLSIPRVPGEELLPLIVQALRGGQQVAREVIGYQSEGITNVDPDVVSQARAAGVEIYHYETGDAYSGGNELLRVWRGQEQWIEYLAASFETVTRRAQQLGVNISSRNEDGWPESIRAFAQWHKEGIVKAFGAEGNWYTDEELATHPPNDPWVTCQRAAQESANQYYREVIKHWWAALKGLTE